MISAGSDNSNNTSTYLDSSGMHHISRCLNTYMTSARDKDLLKYFDPGLPPLPLQSLANFSLSFIKFAFKAFKVAAAFAVVAANKPQTSNDSRIFEGVYSVYVRYDWIGRCSPTRSPVWKVAFVPFVDLSMVYRNGGYSWYKECGGPGGGRKTKMKRKRDVRPEMDNRAGVS